MSSSALSYPYPVIGNGEDVEGRFVVAKFVRTSDPDNIRFDYGFEVTNPTLAGLIDDGKSVFMIQVECSGTFYREYMTVKDYFGSFQIPSNELREKVTVRFYVCASADIDGYLPAGSHADYNGFSFSVEKGDILALGGTTSFIAEKSFDPLRQPVDSLFRIKPSQTITEARPDFENDKIEISLPESDFQLYREAISRGLSDNIHASIIFPVLVDAINKMNYARADFEQYAWFDRVNDICLNSGANITEPLEAAQRILANPIGRNFMQIESKLKAAYADGGEE